MFYLIGSWIDPSCIVDNNKLIISTFLCIIDIINAKSNIRAFELVNMHDTIDIASISAFVSTSAALFINILELIIIDYDML